jgi:predicted 3-demethylubiquinone-9 3-methyltransferase (glyoxalase superfamily)
MINNGIQYKIRSLLIFCFSFSVLITGCQQGSQQEYDLTEETAAGMKVMPFLMFSGDNHGKAEEAVDFYLSFFEDSAITSKEWYGENEGGEPGTIKIITFTIADVAFMAFNSPADHPFNFTPSISFFVSFTDESRLDTAYAKLSEEGTVLMAAGDYGFSRKFGWVEDRYGISWQLNME